MADISKLTDLTNPNVIHNIKDAYARGLIVECTQAEYDAMASHDPNVLYCITDGSTSYPTAEEMRFDPTGTGLSATSVQGAIEEVVSGLTTYTEDGWRVRKWADGTLECWKSYSKQVEASTVDVAIWVVLPSGFIEAPCVTCGTIAGDGDLYETHIIAISAGSIRFAFINRHTAAMTIGTGIHAIGRWK